MANAVKADWIIPEEPDALRDKVLGAVEDALSHEALAEEAQDRVLAHVDSAMSLNNTAEIAAEGLKEPEDEWQRQTSQVSSSKNVHFQESEQDRRHWEQVAAHKVLESLFMRLSLKPKPPAAPPPASKRPVRKVNSPEISDVCEVALQPDEDGRSAVAESFCDQVMDGILTSLADEEFDVDSWTHALVSNAQDEFARVYGGADDDSVENTMDIEPLDSWMSDVVGQHLNMR